MYHEVLPDDVMLPAWTVVRESDFLWQIHYLQLHFDVITMDKAMERVTGKQKGKRPFAVVTFDDGYKGNLETVLPIMEKMGLPFVLYVATQAVIENNLYWYDKIINLLNAKMDVRVNLALNGKSESFMIPYRGNEPRRWLAVERLLTCLKQLSPAERENSVSRVISEYGGISPVLEMISPENLQRLGGSNCVTIGAHTHGHELLDQLDHKVIRETLLTANEHITRLTGSTPRHFSYPNGNFDMRVRDLVQKAGYASAVTTRPGTWSKKNSIFEIPRIGIGRFETNNGFRARVSGFL